MNWQKRLNDDPLPWLLAPDSENPAVRYFTLTDILNRPADDSEVIGARRDLMATGPVPAILEAQETEGYWVEPGPGYYPKYRGTVWQLIFLAQFGADGEDPGVSKACDYVLSNSRSSRGGFSMTGTPSGMIQCLQGNLGAALVDLGWLGDERLDSSLEWMARSITGQGIAPAGQKHEPIRYLRSGNSGPGFLCSANNHLPCAWGAIKSMLAMAKVPPSKRTEIVNEALEVGVEFLLGSDPAVADYPMGYSTKPNRSWFKFGYPIAYVTDVLQNL